MFFEVFPSFFSDCILCVGLPANELLGGLDVSDCFQCFQVAGQVPVGQLHQLLHRIEVSRFIHRKNRHNT